LGVHLTGKHQVALAVFFCVGARVFAETPTEGDSEGKLATFGGQAVASASTGDPDFFDQSDYDNSALRVRRLDLDGSLRLGRRASLLAEVRGNQGDGVSVSALYIRFRPFLDRSLDFQLGRIPPSFGAFGRHGYGADNPLIGYPLGWQYLTSLRADAIPDTSDELLRWRASGWHLFYPIGAQTGAHGLPVATADRWSTGLQVHVGSEPVSLALALTTGTLSHPTVRETSGGKQVSGRLQFKPTIGLVMGLSASRGLFLDRSVTEVLPPGTSPGPYTQQALGFDAEYSRGYWLVRTEGIFSEWKLPAVAPPLLLDPLKATALSLEGRYKLRPGLYVALRLDRLSFSRITGTLFDGKPTPWDAPVSRVEAGAGYYIRRNLLVKGAYQYNWREGTRLGIMSGQILLWF
jgi:hypothetical protein